MEFKPICWLVCRTHLNVIVTGGLLGLSHWATTFGFSWLILQVSYSSLLTLYTRYLSSSSVPRTPRAPGPPPRGQMMFSWSNSNGELPDRCHHQLLFSCKELRKRLKDFAIMSLIDFDFCWTLRSYMMTFLGWHPRCDQCYLFWISGYWSSSTSSGPSQSLLPSTVNQRGDRISLLLGAPYFITNSHQTHFLNLISLLSLFSHHLKS